MAVNSAVHSYLIVRYSAGDKVAADARLLEAVHLEAGEAAITGESIPVSKKAGLITLDSGLMLELVDSLF